MMLFGNEELGTKGVQSETCRVLCDEYEWSFKVASCQCIHTNDGCEIVIGYC